MHIDDFLSTSAKYFFGELPCTAPASKRGPAPSQSPDDIEEEFAKHRAHVRQTNDVVDDKITK